MKIVAVSMVRDEADILPWTVPHLFDQGVDEAIIADNVSVDGTRDLLNDLAARFPIVVLDDPEPRFYQSRKMTRLAHLAGDRGAQWIVPFDADERWYGIDGTIRDVLHAATVDAVFAWTWEHVPQPNDPPGLPPHRRNDRKRLPKVACRYRHDLGIADGNHDVTPGRSRAEGLTIREFQYRSLAHLTRKVRQGREALERANLPDSSGAHWRHLGSLTDDELAAEWERMTSPDGLVWDPAA